MIAWQPYAMSMAQLLVAVLLGSLIGLERQRRQRTAGLRTNALVALGAAAFVMTGTMVSGELSPTRIASQVVSGIGFLCAGVIMRDGFSVRGLNTAATLWCSAAVGVMAGTGFIFHATLVTLVVLLAHSVLRPLAAWLNRQPVDDQAEVLVGYQLRVLCARDEEAHIRALLLHMLNGSELSLRALQSCEWRQEDTRDGLALSRVQADLRSSGQQHSLLERIVSRLSLEGVVYEVSWVEQRLDDDTNRGDSPGEESPASAIFTPRTHHGDSRG